MIRASNTINRLTIVQVLLFFFCVQFSYAQLPTFSLSVSQTDESCTGNGALNFSVSGTAPGASVFYSVYLIPDITTPIAVVNTPSLGGLAAGSYQVVATQSLGGESNTQQQVVQILDVRSPLTFDVIGEPVNCLTGKITVNIGQGTVASYEISAGPVVVPPQASNVFLNLPIGQYTIKVTDICGDVFVRDFTLVYVFDPTKMTIGSNVTGSCDLTTCDTKSVNYHIRAPIGSNILYPFDVQLTVFPPNGGTPMVFNQTLSSGAANSQTVPFTIPHYDANYLTNIRFTDLCGNVYEQNGISVNGTHSMILGPQLPSACHKQIVIDGCNLKAPYMIEFVSTPPGFNPVTFNPLGSGPFDALPMWYNYNEIDAIEIPSGDYVIKITDACGTVLQKQITIKKSVTDHRIITPRYFNGCVLSSVVNIPSAGIPINTAVITQAPVGYANNIPHDVSSLINNHRLEITLTVYGTYVFSGINICNEPYELTIEIRPPVIKPFVLADNAFGCVNFLGQVSIGYEERIIDGIDYEEGPEWAIITITQAPPEFGQQLPYDVSSSIMADPSPPFKNTIAFLDGLPVGDYVFYLTDVCNVTYGPYPVTVPLKPYLDPPAIAVLEGCEAGMGSVRLTLPGGSGNIRFQTVTMIAAPATSTFAALLPYNVDFGITPGRSNFSMNNLPEGVYTFQTKDLCGIEHTVEVTVGNHFYDSTADFVGNCGSFNLFIHHPPPAPGNAVYYVLQKWNPVISQWTHPLTGFVFQPGTYPNGVNSYVLNDVNYNITSQGYFRILKLSFIFSTGSDTMIPCITTLKEFEFLGQLKITNAYKISCVSGSSQVFIVAGDTNPLHYYITEKDNQPFNVDNNESNVFTGLAPGIYNFMVQDQCGNEVNRLFDVTSLDEPEVTASNLCDGQAGLLSMPPFSFLSYQWWKAGDPTTILSTTNELHFSPFSLATTPGTYYIRIYSQSTLSCLDTTISYVVPTAIAPYAGDDDQLTICARGPLNLNTYLSGTADTNGFWSEITNSGMLTGSVWLPINVAAGVYQFKYTVNGFCGIMDEATLTINVLENLPIPVVTMNPISCTGNDIHFEVVDIPNVAFEWSGPNNFTSTEQNPTIANSTVDNNGLYTVKATANGCESSGNIVVNLQPGPEFHLNASCVNSVYTVAAIANYPSALDGVTYSWTGPENFTSNQNPIPIAGLSPGMYGVTITSQLGCVVTDEVQVNTTVCTLPNVITPNDDATNDNWDLTEFDVRRVEIYSRWGRLVYEQNNYTDQWHGQNSHNEELPDSTYYYILYLGSGEEKQGWVFKTSW